MHDVVVGADGEALPGTGPVAGSTNGVIVQIHEDRRLAAHRVPSSMECSAAPARLMGMRLLSREYQRARHLRLGNGSSGARGEELPIPPQQRR
jgi:hypothetical protein